MSERADGGPAKVRRAATLLARCHARPCRRVQASAGECSRARVQKSCLTPPFLGGGSAQLSGARETNRCVRWRAWVWISPSALALLSKRLHRCATLQPDEQVQKSVVTPEKIWPARARERERERWHRRISLVRLACCLLLSRARPTFRRASARQHQPPSWPALNPLSRHHQSSFPTHPTCRPSPNSPTIADANHGQRNSVLIMLVLQQ